MDALQPRRHHPSTHLSLGDHPQRFPEAQCKLGLDQGLRVARRLVKRRVELGLQRISVTTAEKSGLSGSLIRTTEQWVTTAMDDSKVGHYSHGDCQGWLDGWSMYVGVGM